MLHLILAAAIACSFWPALPDIRVELIPANPGPYVGGESFTVDVWLHSEMSEDGRLRGVRFDFALTDSQIATAPAFTFDFSTLKSPQNDYTTLPDLPLPETQNSFLYFCPQCYLLLTAGGSLRIGSVSLQLPAQSGTYRLDALNAMATDFEHGALIWVDYSPLEGIRQARMGEIVGGDYDFVVDSSIPAVSQWGIFIIGLSLLTLGSLTLRVRSGGVLRSRKLIAFMIVLWTLGMAHSPATFAQTTIPTDTAILSIDSGLVSAIGTGPQPVVVFSTPITVTNAGWIRLHFSQVLLSGSVSSGNASFLRITSAQDGSNQLLNSPAAALWANTSAMMRGSQVTLELLAYRNTGNNRVAVDQAMYGLVPDPPPGGIACVDDRVPWTDPRAARFVFETPAPACTLVGCTAFLISNNQNCFLTAGHCCAILGFSPACLYWPIVEFNVPLSHSPSGRIVPALPQDQYPLDPDSVQDQQGSYTLGNDWCYFGVWNNYNTGLSPYTAQGSAHVLATNIPTMSGTGMRVSGYGHDSTPQYNQTLQTDTGSFSTYPGAHKVECQAYASGGASGFAMEYSGTAYAIATNAPCIDEVPYVQGTLVDHPDLRAAIAAGLGVCQDCNRNTIPDSYENGIDCNGNGILDDCETPNGACCRSHTPNDCVQALSEACCYEAGGIWWYGLGTRCRDINCFLGPSGPQGP